MSRARDATRRPSGVGLITWSVDRSVVELALGYHPDPFMLSFGDARPYAPSIKAAGCRLICQVQECPYCIRGHTKLALRRGATDEEIMEAIWVAAEMRAGAAYAHSVLAIDAMHRAEASPGA